MFIPAITDKWGPKAFERKKGPAAAFTANKVGGKQRNFKWQVRRACPSPPSRSSRSRLSVLLLFVGAGDVCVRVCGSGLSTQRLDKARGLKGGTRLSRPSCKGKGR